MRHTRGATPISCVTKSSNEFSPARILLKLQKAPQTGSALWPGMDFYFYSGLVSFGNEKSRLKKMKLAFTTLALRTCLERQRERERIKGEESVREVHKREREREKEREREREREREKERERERLKRVLISKNIRPFFSFSSSNIFSVSPSIRNFSFATDRFEDVFIKSIIIQTVYLIQAVDVRLTYGALKNV